MGRDGEIGKARAVTSYFRKFNTLLKVSTGLKLVSIQGLSNTPGLLLVGRIREVV